MDSYELEVHEELLLLEACRVADRLDVLANVGEEAPTTVRNRFGEEVTAPHLVEARMPAGTLARLVASLRLPQGETADGELARPQRRGSARAFGIRGSVAGGAL